jgi:hypothetical protein
MDSLYSINPATAHTLTPATVQENPSQRPVGVYALPRSTDSFDTKLVAEPDGTLDAPMQKQENPWLMPVLAGVTGLVTVVAGIVIFHKPTREKVAQFFSGKKPSTPSKTTRVRPDALPDDRKSFPPNTPAENVIAGIYQTLMDKTDLEPWEHWLKTNRVDLQNLFEVQHHCLAVVQDPQTHLDRKPLTQKRKDKLEEISNYLIEKQLKEPPEKSPLLKLTQAEKDLALACAYYNHALLLAMLENPQGVLKHFFEQCASYLKKVDYLEVDTPANALFKQMKTHLPNLDNPAQAAAQLRETLYPKIKYVNTDKDQAIIDQQKAAAAALKTSIAMLNIPLPVTPTPLST